MEKQSEQRRPERWTHAQCSFCGYVLTVELAFKGQYVLCARCAAAQRYISPDQSITKKDIAQAKRMIEKHGWDVYRSKE